MATTSKSEPSSSAPAKKRPGRLSYVLMGGHVCVDACQGGLAALLPFLVLYGGYGYAEVTALILASNIASAVIQPLFGWLGDRVARPWLMALGVLLAGIGIATIGVVDAYWLVVASAMVSGIGNAMLHPEGGRLANLVGGDDPATSLGIFSTGGQVGFCLGPIVAAAAISAFGLPGTLMFLVFCVPYAVLLLALNGRFAAYGLRAARSGAADINAHDHWGAFVVLLGTLSIRSIVFYGITSFVPLFMVAAFAQSEQFASSMITVFSGVGACATFCSGRAANRFKTTHIMLVCFAFMAVALAAFVASPHIALCVVALMACAVCVNLFNPPAIALGQGFLPNHLGMASGLSFGVAVCIGGVVSPLLGVLGDNVGLVPVFWVLVVLAVTGFALAAAVKAIVVKLDIGE